MWIGSTGIENNDELCYVRSIFNVSLWLNEVEIQLKKVLNQILDEAAVLLSNPVKGQIHSFTILRILSNIVQKSNNRRMN